MLQINNAGYIRVPSGWSLTPERTRKWTDFDLWYLIKGKGSVEHSAGITRLHPGICLLMQGGKDYLFRQLPGNSFTHYWVHFDYVDNTGATIPLPDAPTPPFCNMITDRQFFESLFTRMILAWNSSAAGHKIQSAFWLQALLEEIQATDRAKHERNTSTNPRFDKLIDSLCHRINENPEKNWVIDKIAHEAGISRSYLFKQFKSRTGLSPQKYTIEARMKMARELLYDSSNSINWIAEKLGYSDVYFFSHQFSLHHGSSPSEYRKGI